MRHLLIGLLFVAASCATGPAAPAIQATELACIEEFCLTYPAGWEVDTGSAYIAFSHPTAPETSIATVAPLNMEVVVESAGGSWPARTEEVVRSFWTLLKNADVATFERLERLTGGSFRSEGSYEQGHLWHLLIPGEGSKAVAAEVRGPNESWEAHADVMFDGLTVTPGGP